MLKLTTAPDVTGAETAKSMLRVPWARLHPFCSTHALSQGALCTPGGTDLGKKPPKGLLNTKASDLSGLVATTPILEKQAAASTRSLPIACPRMQ